MIGRIYVVAIDFDRWRSLLWRGAAMICASWRYKLFFFVDIIDCCWSNDVDQTLDGHFLNFDDFAFFFFFFLLFFWFILKTNIKKEWRKDVQNLNFWNEEKEIEFQFLISIWHSTKAKLGFGGEKILRLWGVNRRK